MPALYSRDGTTDAFPRRVRGGRRALTAPVALVSLGFALTMMLGSPVPSSADNGPNDVDVDPDSATLATGDLVSLTALLTAGADHDRWWLTNRQSPSPIRRFTSVQTSSGCTRASTRACSPVT